MAARSTRPTARLDRLLERQQRLGILGLRRDAAAVALMQSAHQHDLLKHDATQPCGAGAREPVDHTGNCKALVKGADTLKRLTADQHRCTAFAAQNILRWTKGFTQMLRYFGADELLRQTKHRFHCGIALENGKLLVEATGCPQVVAILESKNVASGARKAGVQCPGRSGIGL